MPGISSFRDLRVLVTGASSGIGRAFALDSARRGARLALMARRGDELASLAEEIHRVGGDAFYAVADVAERDEVDDACAKLSSDLGGIDLLCNNAGYGHHRAFLDWDVDDMERMMRVNFLGSLYATKAVVPQMVDRGSGWLVFVSSVAGRIGPPDESAYVASKFAMTGFAESISLELEEHGIHVLTVYPGAIDTPFFDEEARQRMPAVAKKTMVQTEGLIDAIQDALLRGKREVTFPRMIRAGYVVRAIAPGIMRKQMKRVTKR